MEDYFGFDVTLIMNITDIDDKIIIRARQAHLFQTFCAAHSKVSSELISELRAMWGAYVADKLGVQGASAQWEALRASMTTVEAQADAKRVLYFSTADKAVAALEGAVEGAEAGALLAAFEDIAAAALDAQQGATVTDQKIFRDLAAFWEGEFLKDMAALNVRPVSLMTRVTEFVPQVIQFVQTIISNGYGYEAEGSVYFDVAAFQAGSSTENGDSAPHHHLYAKLCPWSAGNCKFFEEGEGSLGVKLSGKRHPQDFALWKASKAGEPSWSSPWGAGRPGWHIECSAMAASVAPGTLDIHSGGIDLAFPHHDNELAQSEAFYQSRQWVNYFLHAGHVHIEGHKMSKSLKNFITIRDALARYTARQLRIMFLQHQWCAPVYYKESSMTTAIAVDALFTNFFSTAEALLRAVGKGEEAPPCSFGPREAELVELLQRTQNRLHAALCDNFDTPAALLLLQELVNRTNVYLQSPESINHYVLKMVVRYVGKILAVFGLEAGAASEAAGDVWKLVGPILEAVSEFRDGVRSAVLSSKGEGEGKEALLTLSDQLRETLTEQGVLFEDRPGKPTLVRLVDRDTMAKIKAEQVARDAEKLARKLETTRISEEKAAAKLAKAALAPADMFRSNPAYSAWDEQGIPTHDASGAELSKNARKKVLKEYEAQVELHQKYLASKQD